MPAFTPLKAVSVVAFFLVLLGFANRRRRHVHIPCMAAAFLMDMGVVLYIELTRGAIESARAHMGPLMVVHICLSVTVVGLYFAQIASGIQKARGRRIPWHRQTGVLFVLTRFGNLVTSFLVV